MESCYRNSKTFTFSYIIYRRLSPSGLFSSDAYFQIYDDASEKSLCGGHRDAIASEPVKCGHVMVWQYVQVDGSLVVGPTVATKF